jgi:electron-transferring-flavoprotein dehydrogenase
MKIAIVGAGISGLYLAWRLSEMGQEVIVFEKKEKIGKEACSGLFSQRILEFIPESQKLIQNEINYCLIHFPKRRLKINFFQKFFVMSHFELDQLVAKLAQRAGAKIILNRPILKSDLSNLQERFERVIGCDGANSLVRKILKLPEPNFHLAIQGFLSQKDNSNFVETWPTKSGFIWKIPRGKEIEYGILEKPKEAQKIFDQFLKIKNLKLERIRSAPIPQGLILPQNQKITLCGDAAGLTKPWSGGGVIWSLRAVNILIKNFPDFLKYQKEVKRFFLPKIIFSKMVKKLVYLLGFKFPWVFPKEIKIEGDFLAGE